jgi:undecaprenyl pyrophosphate phosphatase UppP
MNVLAIALGIVVWFVTDVVLMHRLVSNASTQEKRLQRGFLFSLNIALALVVAIICAGMLYQ